MDIWRREIFNENVLAAVGTKIGRDAGEWGNGLGHLTNGSVDRVWKPGSSVDIILSRR
jgi:hypothetical protein